MDVDERYSLLSQEAEIIAPLLQEWCSSNCSNRHPFDLVGAFILVYLAVRRPKKYISSKLKKTIISIEIEKEKLFDPRMKRIGFFTGLVDILCKDYIRRKCLTKQEV